MRPNQLENWRQLYPETCEEDDLSHWAQMRGRKWTCHHMVKKIQTHCLVVICVYPVDFNGIPCESERCEGFYNDWTVTDVISVMRMYFIVSQT